MLFERQYSRTIPSGSKFILYGNNIDGNVNFGKQVFSSFEELQRQLPKLISKIEGIGEWDICLYAVNDVNIKTTYQYGYYQKPKRGKQVFTLSYMNSSQTNKLTITDSEIILSGKSIYESRGEETKEYTTLEKTKLKFV